MTCWPNILSISDGGRHRRARALAVGTVGILVFVSLGLPARAQFLPPGVINPSPASYGGDDVFVSHVIGPDLTIHAVWASSNSYDSSGGDPDIFYSKNSGGAWSAPILVNTYGDSDDFSDERLPRLALGADGVLHCVWQSQVDYQSAGSSDWDIFYARLNPGSSSWSPAEHASNAVGDSSDDVEANVAAFPDGSALVIFQDSVGLTTEIRSTVRDETGGWSARLVRSGQSQGPAAMTTTEDGDILAAWVLIDNPTGHRTIVRAEFQGTSYSGTFPLNAEMNAPTAEHFAPAVAVYGSGSDREEHYVWSSTQDLGGIGTDYDLLHYVRLERPPYSLGPFPVNSTAASDGGANDSAPSLCFEPGGVLHVAWESNLDYLTGSDWDVYHADNAAPGGEWSAVGFLGLNAFFDGVNEVDQRSNLACAGNHVLSGAWQSKDDLLEGTPNGTDYNIFHALGLGRLYHRPTHIAGFARNGTETDVGVRLATNGHRVHAVWSSDYTGSGGDTDIYHSELISDRWSVASPVNSNAHSGSGDLSDLNPDVAVDAKGRAHVVWSSNSNLAGSGGDFDIFYSFDDGSGWTEPELVNIAGTGDTGVDDHLPRIGLDGAGNIHVVWRVHQPNLGLRYARRSGGTWSAAQAPATPDSSWTPSSYDLLVESNGTVHVVWHGTSAAYGPDEDVFYIRRDPFFGTWSSPRLVNDFGNGDVGDDADPAIDLASNGEAVVVWSSEEDVDGAGTDSDLLLSRCSLSACTPADLLLTRATVESASDGGPDVAITGDRLDVAWVSTDGLDFGVAGSDPDIFHAQVSLSGALPVDAPIGAANPNAYGDFGLDDAPSIAVSSTDVVLFAWDSTDDLGGLIGTDWDVLFGRLGDGSPTGAEIFADGFESGDLTAW